GAPGLGSARAARGSGAAPQSGAGVRTVVRSDSTIFSACPARISSTAAVTRAWYSSGVCAAATSSGSADAAGTGEEGNRCRQLVGQGGYSSPPTTESNDSPSCTPG